MRNHQRHRMYSICVETLLETAHRSGSLKNENLDPGTCMLVRSAVVERNSEASRTQPLLLSLESSKD